MLLVVTHLHYDDTIGQYFLPLYPVQQCSVREQMMIIISRVLVRGTVTCIQVHVLHECTVEMGQYRLQEY